MSKGRAQDLARIICTCPVCGGQQSLDLVISQAIEDGEARRLIGAVIEWSVPVGSAVVRYLRLFKPARQRLRIATAQRVLEELLPAVIGGRLNRHGAAWAMDERLWHEAFASVFAQADSGRLDLPLTGNAYLFEVAARLAEKAKNEGRPVQRSTVPADDAAARTRREIEEHERKAQQARDSGATAAGRAGIAKLLGKAGGKLTNQTKGG